MTQARALAAFSSMFVVLVAGGARARADATLVTLIGGKAQVQGTYNPYRDTLEWKGIRYAQPPIGPLRWRPPLPIELKGLIDASEYGAPCTQPGWDASQEDCLFLNVTAPRAVTGTPMPVIVDIHGGGNFVGAGDRDLGGWARHGVVVVAMNYRLGTLSFIGLPELTAEGGGSSSNYGIRDQIAALQWVQANIAAFGGDPGNVTISGFSAGANDTITLMASPLAKGLFKRAMPSSFFINGVTSAGNTLADAENVGIAIGNSLGCPSALQPDMLDCMRSLPAADLANAWNDINTGGAATIDGQVLTAPVGDTLERDGSVPLLVGNAREEDGGQVYDPGTPDPMSRGQYTLWSNDLLGSTMGATMRPYYTEEAYGTLRWAFLYMQFDADNVCPTRRVALAPRPVTYKYLSTHILDNDDHLVRAAHGSDVTLIWDATWYLQTPAEAAMSHQMTRYFTNFAKKGDPNDDELPPLPRWQPYTAGVEQYLEFADTPMPRSGGYHVTECTRLGNVPIFVTCGALCKWFTLSQPAVLFQVFHFFKLTMCHQGETIQVEHKDVDRHLAEGDVYGACIVPVTLPGRIEAENYAYGGEGIGYHDDSPGTYGGYYRFDDVDIRLNGTRDGYQVGWTDPGEWLAFDIIVPETRGYTLTAHLASGCCAGPKTFHLEVDGVDVSGPITFEWVLDWNTIHDVVATGIPLTAGSHRLHFVWDDLPFDLDAFDLR
jgi:para-nitrobenzyl esterase